MLQGGVESELVGPRVLLVVRFLFFSSYEVAIFCMQHVHLKVKCLKLQIVNGQSHVLVFLTAIYSRKGS